ncbi:MAG TPA: PAS domain S-box protein [Candidatus Binatia bacterium]|jgi:PAS domain S-box-containing protein|nr:PAS domain S-box protein [Candidatus Binatia bacterium]
MGTDIIALVAETEASLLGFIIGAVVTAPPIYNSGGLVCIVDDFAVANPTEWGSIGVALLVAVEQEAKNGRKGYAPSSSLRAAAGSLVCVVGGHMKDTNKTRAQLIEELSLLRQQLAARPSTAAHHEQTQATLLSLSSVVQASIDSIVLADLTGKILDVNEATLKMYGTNDKGDLIGKNTLELIALADRQRAVTYFQEVLAQGHLKGREYQVLLKSGATIPVELSAALLKDAAGTPLGLVGITRDISERKQMEEALRQSEARFQRIATNFPGGMIFQFLLRPDGSVAFPYVSPNARDLYEMEPEEIQRNAARVFALVHPEDRAGLDQSIALSAQTLSPWCWEFRLITASGILKWFRGVSRPEWQANGDILWDGLVTDVTDRKRAEEVLREQAQIIDQIHDAVIATDLAGSITTWNKGAERLYGYTAEEMRGHSIARLYPVEDRDILQHEVIAPLTEKGHHEVEVRARTKTGAHVWVQLSLALLRNQAGVPYRMIRYAMDITERKQAEEAAQQEAQITAALAQVGRELIGSFDTLALLQRLCQLITEVLKSDCSHALLWQPQTGVYVPMASHGHAPEQWEALRTLMVSAAFLNDLLAQLEHEEVVSLEVAKLQSLPLGVFAQQSGLTYMLVTTVRRGTKIIGLLTAAYREHPAPFTPQAVRMLRGTGRLASVALEKARLLEELQQANQTKSEFLATMSHELRTPLSVVIGYTDLLLEGDFGPTTAEQNAALQRVRSAASQEVELITTLLDLSRLEAGRVRLTIAAVDIPALIAELRQETENGKRKPGLHFEWRVAPEVPLLWTDRFQLKVILTNLISNAVKFTERGSVLVAVSPSEGGVECSGTDTGSGIAPEVQAVMFEMFRQGDSATVRHYEGVGLGLYIVKHLLELLHGTIVVESAVGKGSTFRVRIPHGSQRTSERVETGPALGLQPLRAEGQAGKGH